MNENDLRKMIDAAGDITRAAQQHEETLKAALAAAERGERGRTGRLARRFHRSVKRSKIGAC